MTVLLIAALLLVAFIGSGVAAHIHFHRMNRRPEDE